MYQNDPMKVLTGEVRLSYANLTTPRAAQQGGEPKYSVTLLIPKTDVATKADIDAAINAAANEALTKVWNGARPPQLATPVWDGDGVRKSGVPFGDECKGHWVITASTKNKPQVVGIDNINCELSPADIYSGITNSFILDNYASQKNKGLHFGLDRLKGFLTDYWNKNHTADGWVLKCDVRHFFASIDHDRLKEKLKKLDLEPALYDLLCVYVDCSDGLPLGYQTSQLFALYYLDEFDHFVKEKLHIRYYGRYMDDFFLIHPDKEYLQYCLTEIQAFMASLGLELNEKTQIFPLRHGMDFLGFHTYLTDSGKVIRKLRHSSVKKMRAKLRRWEKEYPTGLVTREEILQSWQAWDAHAAHGNTWTLRQQVRDRVQNILKEEI